MEFIYSIEALKKAVFKIIPELTDTIPYIGDRNDIFSKLWLDYQVMLPFKDVFTIVTEMMINIQL